MRIFIISLLFICVNTFASNEYIPPQAFQYKETIRTEINNHFPDLIDYNYVPSLIEHESCISLKSKRCWRATSELRTSREQGIGFFQITRTFRTDGSVRFDTLSDMKKLYKQDLQAANWDDIKYQPKIQIRMGILMLRDNYKRLYNVPDVVNRLQMMDAAHNTGIGNVFKKRRACGLAKNCNPNVWYNNVADQCIGLNAALYGKRSACDIVKHHVFDVFENKLPKYQRHYYLKGE